MRSSSNFFKVVVFLVSSLVTGPSFMSISLLVLQLWQFLLVRDWPDIRKSEIPLSICPIPENWGKLRIPNLAGMCLMKSYLILQNTRFTPFTVSKLFREKCSPLPRAGLKSLISSIKKILEQGTWEQSSQMLQNACKTSWIFFACPVWTMRVSHAQCVWLDIPK